MLLGSFQRASQPWLQRASLTFWSVAQDKLKEQGGIYSKVDCFLRPLTFVCIALLGTSANI